MSLSHFYVTMDHYCAKFPYMKLTQAFEHPVKHSFGKQLAKRKISKNGNRERGVLHTSQDERIWSAQKRKTWQVNQQTFSHYNLS